MQARRSWSRPGNHVPSDQTRKCHPNFPPTPNFSCLLPYLQVPSKAYPPKILLVVTVNTRRTDGLKLRNLGFAGSALPSQSIFVNDESMKTFRSRRVSNPNKHNWCLWRSRRQREKSYSWGRIHCLGDGRLNFIFDIPITVRLPVMHKRPLLRVKISQMTRRHKNKPILYFSYFFPYFFHRVFSSKTCRNI